MTDYRYLIGVGSNLGDRIGYLEEGVKQLGAHDGNELQETSSIIETDPLGPADKAFLNMAAIVKSSIVPLKMLQLLLAIEDDLGRTRSLRWGNRTIDLDILLVYRGGQSIIWDSSQLKVPHPEMLKRDFVMIPACEIAAEWVHPDTGVSLGIYNGQRAFGLSVKEQSVKRCYSFG